MDGWKDGLTGRGGEWMDRWMEDVGGWMLGVRWADQWVSRMNHLMDSQLEYLHS